MGRHFNILCLLQKPILAKLRITKYSPSPTEQPGLKPSMHLKATETILTNLLPGINSVERQAGEWPNAVYRACAVEQKPPAGSVARIRQSRKALLIAPFVSTLETTAVFGKVK